MTGWRPELIALDVDGTILPAGGTISPAVREAIATAVDQGAHVVLATGRTVVGVADVIAELGFTRGVALCSNGAVRLDLATGVITELATFEPGPVITHLRRLLPGGVFSMEETGHGNRVSAGYPLATLFGRNRVVEEAELVAAPTTRLVAHWAGLTQLDLAALLTEHGIPGVTWTYDHGTEAWLTVVGDGISKASALELIRIELGVPAGATIAFGDGHNDIAMLRWAACGVAMGNASEEVKAAADEVTGLVTEDGVAAVLGQLFRSTAGTAADR